MDFWITHKLKFFLTNWEVVFFRNFSHRIYNMYVPEGMCIVGHRKPITETGRAILSTMMDIIIPRNDVLILLSLPPDFKKKRRVWKIGCRTFFVQ